MEIKNIIKKDLNDPNALASVGHLSYQRKQRKVEPLKQYEKPHLNKIDNLRKYANLRTIGLVAIAVLAIYAALSASSENISPDTTAKLFNDISITPDNIVNTNIPKDLSNLNKLFEENLTRSKEREPKTEIFDGKEYTFIDCDQHNDQLDGRYKRYLIKFNDGGYYQGQLKNSIRWGQGKMTYKPDHPFRTYEGQWENDEPNGEGLLIYKNEPEYYGIITEYYGIINNGLPYKEGQYTYRKHNANNYEQYKGQFDDKYLPHGKGTMTYGSSSIFHSYEGLWKHGSLVEEEDGKVIYKNGDWFRGNFESGAPDSGDGKKTYANCGDGKKTYKDGSVFEGQFEAGFPNGKGMYTSSNGDVYKSDFFTTTSAATEEFSERLGTSKGGFPKWLGISKGGFPRWLGISKTGELEFSNGDYYQGEFDSSLRPTKGKMTFKDKSVYEGDFKEGLPEDQYKLKMM